MNLLNSKNPLQSYAEQTHVGNNMANLGITDVTIDCPIHGVQTVKTLVFRQHDVKCPECDKLAQYERQAKEFCEAQRNQALKSGISQRYYGMTLADYQVTTDLQHKLVSFCEAWLSDFGVGSKNIALLGSTGTGKTMLASVLASAVMSKGRSVQMLRSSDIADQVHASWKPQSKISEADLMKSWISCDLLVIDELGEGDISANIEWADKDRVRLSKIIDGRYQNGKPIIFTSNFGKDQFFARLGARALDRFQQNAVLIVCNWQSYRKAVSQFLEIV